MNDRIGQYLQKAVHVGIAGHTRPDGDCVGVCLALYHYLRENYPQIQADVYLEPVPGIYSILAGFDVISHEYTRDIAYDVFFALDASDKERLAGAVRYFDEADRTVCIDHHISNRGFADVNVIRPQASSACEVLAGMMDMTCVDRETAAALYTGLICDTGCFRHSNTSEETMRLAGALIAKGIDFSLLTDRIFYEKTFVQNQLLGRCLLESFLMFNGKCIISVADLKVMGFYQAASADLEGVIDQLRVTTGVEVALLLTQIEEETFKVSMRSNALVNVAAIAEEFGGGGHVRAAGCTINGTKHAVINQLTVYIEEQLGV